MNFTESQIIEIVSNATNRSFLKIKPVLLSVVDMLALRNNAPASLPNTDKVYFGKLSINVNQQLGIVFTTRSTVDNTTLSVGMKEPSSAPKVYPVMFDKINGEFDEDNEMIFVGYELQMS